MFHEAVAIGDEAARHVRMLLSEQRDAPPSAGLRIDVIPGGCSGHQYRLALDDTRPGDSVFDASGVRVLVAEDAMRFVLGATVEYDLGVGFRVDNPNVVYSCGCGSSFELAEGVGSLTT